MALAWEAAVVDGHATHPNHRCRQGLSLPHAYLWCAEMGGFVDLCFARVEKLRVQGPFWELLEGWLPEPGLLPIHPGQAIQLGHDPGELQRPIPVEAMRWAGGAPLEPAGGGHHHHHQHTHSVVDVPLEWTVHRRRAWTQASLRTVCPEGLGLHLKLPLAVTTTSALRTVSPFSLANGPRISALLERLAPPGLHVIRELASAGLVHEDWLVARHVGCILRADPQRELPGEDLVVACALVERDEHGVRLLARVTDEPVAFVRDYGRRLLAAVLPLLDRGIALEAHGQNLLVRFRGGQLVGFAVRDFGGVRIHRPTLQEPLELLEDSATDAATIEEVWAKLHHALFQMHLAELIRAAEELQPGCDEALWEGLADQVRSSLRGEARAFFLAPTAPTKCFLRMRLEEQYSQYITRPGPNPLAGL